MRDGRAKDFLINCTKMITHRPQHLLSDAAYQTLPKAPLSLDWGSVPELLCGAIRDLRGIQPQTKAMADAAGGELQFKPSEGEIKLFQGRGTTFQSVSVVLSLLDCGEIDGARQFRPFAVTLIPATKRDQVTTKSIDDVSKVDVEAWLQAEPMYTGYDPFTGAWSLYGLMPGYFDGERKRFLDEIGVVVEQFFLATDSSTDEILLRDLDMPSEEGAKHYTKRRKKLFYTPFDKLESRRIWGAETAIELFLMQGLAKEKLLPECQMLIMKDGTVFPSLFHLWRDPAIRKCEDIISPADLYFPKERLAVYCDGGNHARRKIKNRDAAIDAKLAELGIRPLRIAGDVIKRDLNGAVVRVKEALAA